jgi:Fur family ferric uptake transcriptional regulator
MAMAEKDLRQTFKTYLESKHLKHSQPRWEIFDTFMQADTHLTAEELYQLVKKKNPGIGSATVYRTLKLMGDSGLCRELKFADGSTHYERLQGKAHHDHLICTHCGSFVEVFDREIEKLQEKLFKLNGYYPQWHRLELYGICGKCRHPKGTLG